MGGDEDFRVVKHRVIGGGRLLLHHIGGVAGKFAGLERREDGGGIGELAAAGKAVVVASSHLPELLGLCDTIGVMCRGSLVAVRPRAEWSEAELLRVSTGAAAPSS